ncbi:MAG TPA: DNA mismatch repair protein MutS [Bacteroidaceae bacterium]|nr:DNA mismatch repair protein MutS [Bacteroidaceae bacterium]
MASEAGNTPMMRQFKELKAKHPDAILLFRCGDFYETYSTDAVIASKILGITLTRRSTKKSLNEPHMAGFPYHALDIYLPKLIRAGKRVAICEQLEDPKKTKKLVKRGITELVTPGVTMSDNVLITKENNFLSAVHSGKGACGVAFVDISTGEFFTAEGSIEYIDKLILNFSPREVVIERGKKSFHENNFGDRFFFSELDDWVFTEEFAREKLKSHFNVRNMKGYGIDHLRNGKVAAGAVLQYLAETLHNNLKHISSISRIEEERFMRLDKFTIRNLELIESMNDDGKSLLNIIDKTVTPMGGRLLRRWLLFPLKEVKPIQDRQDIVEFFYKNKDVRDIIIEGLRQTGDLERIISKASIGRISPREVVQLKNSLLTLERVKNACLEADNPLLNETGAGMDLCKPLVDRISHEIDADAPIAVNRGGVIASGVNTELDELRNIVYSGKEYLLNIQQREVEATGIPSLKIAYNNVFGYYIEVRNTHKEKVPKEWIRKQTLVNAERYITQELKIYEEKILGAEEKILALESELFNKLVEYISLFVTAIQKDANLAARLDCLSAFSVLAEERKYNRPQIDESDVVDIKQGRHPVIETELPLSESYIANDIFLDSRKQQILIITGPNMSGKSALLRQTALIVLLAQIGSYVPAEGALIGVVDKIFTRVGASDNISVGESTFMVEMIEAASIINNLSPKSLVLFDELGRGTSTYDGISIAWAIVEYIHEHIGTRAKTLFATHYHELNEMAGSFSRIRNFNVSVKEIDNRVLFLRKLEPGGSRHSFGIHVAEMAGIPASIVKRANEILAEMERVDTGRAVSKPIEQITTNREGLQTNIFQLDDPLLCQIRDEILSLDINNLTPVEALNKLNDIKKIIRGR